MKLYQDKKLFSETLSAASQELNIRLEFVEKGYRTLLILSHQAESKYASEVVFKGSTSLIYIYGLPNIFIV